MSTGLASNLEIYLTAVWLEAFYISMWSEKSFTGLLEYIL